MEKVHRLEEAGLAPSRMWKQSFIIRPTVCWAQGIVRPARKGLGGSDIEPALNGYGALSASNVMCQWNFPPLKLTRSPVSIQHA
jgi:hypothetical protein